MARRTPLKKKYLEEKMRGSGVLNEPLTKDLLINFFEKRIDTIDWGKAKMDVRQFIKDENQIKIWSSEFFKELIQKIELV